MVLQFITLNVERTKERISDFVSEAEVQNNAKV